MTRLTQLCGFQLRQSQPRQKLQTYLICLIFLVFTKKSPNFTELQPSASASIRLGPKPKLDRMATKRTIVKLVIGEIWGEKPACKTSLFPSSCNCPHDTEFRMSSLSILRQSCVSLWSGSCSCTWHVFLKKS